jgi:hypothetical protein
VKVEPSPSGLENPEEKNRRIPDKKEKAQQICGFGSNSTGGILHLSCIKDGLTKLIPGLEYDGLWHKMVCKMAVAYHYTIGHITRRDLEVRKNILSEGFSPPPGLMHLGRLTIPFGMSPIKWPPIVCADRSLATLSSQNYDEDCTAGS